MRYKFLLNKKEQNPFTLRDHVYCENEPILGQAGLWQQTLKMKNKALERTDSFLRTSLSPLLNPFDSLRLDRWEDVSLNTMNISNGKCVIYYSTGV
jgi:hypothetical protein